MRVLTARDTLGYRNLEQLRQWVQKDVRRNVWAPADGKLPGPERIAADAGLVARVYHGLWIVDCDCCNGAQVVHPGDPFQCVGCYNHDHDYCWRPVIFPPDAVRQQIEALLSKRRRPEEMNWFPHETVADLARENAEHGVH